MKSNKLKLSSGGGLVLELKPVEKSGQTPKKDPERKPVDSSRVHFESKTILFNDDQHTFDEVAAQLVKAIRCTFTKGLELAHRVHSEGSAVVYSGHLERCEAVAMVLEEIRLKAIVER